MKSYLEKICWAYVLGLTSAFNSPSVLKSRILMLYRKPSGNISLAKFAFVLPVLLVCGLLNACLHKDVISAKISQNKLDNPRVILLKNQQGEPVETLHFDGEKSDYEKVADKIGLNRFLAEKEQHTAAETMQLYQDILGIAIPEVKDKEDAVNMQGALYSVLLEKNVHKSTDIKQVAFMAQEMPKHPFSLYFFVQRNQMDWFAEVMPKLKKHWSAKKYDAYKKLLVNTIGGMEGKLLSPEKIELRPYIEAIAKI